MRSKAVRQVRCGVAFTQIHAVGLVQSVSLLRAFLHTAGICAIL